MTSTPPHLTSSRFGALDGLRGLAALIVVFYHGFELSRPYLIARSGPNPMDGVTWYSFFLETPGWLLVAGPQAVYVFFVLSGFVLTLPVLRAGSFDWVSYYPRRLVRLYLPSLASLVLAVLLVALIPRDPSTAQSHWLIENNATTLDGARIVREATLTTIAPLYNGPLWSLFLEIAFSLLLPAYVAIALFFRRMWWLAGILCLVVAAYGNIIGDYGFMLLPVFLLGALIAVRLDDLQRMTERGGRAAGWWWLAAAVLGACLLVPAAFIPALFEMPYGWTIIHACWSVGAVLIVLGVLGSAPLARMFETLPFRILGRLSFSLYLVHVPVLVTVAYLLGNDRWVTVVVVGGALSLAVAWLFYIGVEGPSHKLSKLVGSRAKRHALRDPEPTPQPLLPRNTPATPGE